MTGTNLSSESVSLGQALICERKKKNISLEEISRRTNIQVKSLQAMEDDDYHLIPGEFYVKSYTKSYLKAIGCEEKAFLETHKDTFRDIGTIAREKKGTYYSKLRYSRFKKRSILFSVLIFVVIFILSVIGLYLGKHNLIESSPGMVVIPAGAVPPIPTRKEFSMDYWPVRVEIEFLDDCWMQVQRGKDNARKKILEQVFQKGDHINVKGYALHFFIGNPSALRFFINNREVTSLKTVARAERFSVTPHNLKDLLQE